MLENINIFGHIENIIQDMFDKSIPIGYVYTQYRNQPAPSELYNNDKIHSVWEEQLQYNSAFFRSDKPSTELWTPDNGSHFYRSASKSSPVSISGLTGGRSTGQTSRNESEGITYTKWNGWSIGKGNVFNDTLQTNQNQYHYHNNSVSLTQPTLSTDKRVSAAFYFESVDANSLGAQGWIASSTAGVNTNDSSGVTITVGATTTSEENWSRSGHKNNPKPANKKYTYSSSHTHTVSRTTDFTASITNVNSGGNENRPDNYTIRIWKRIA